MKIKDASGTQGLLINNHDGSFCFRVYNKDENGKHVNPVSFIDYKIHHSDLAVTIGLDDEAAFYYPEDDRQPILDHPPSTLGLEKDK